jgi:mannose-6-phosphate isomerase
VTIETAAVHVKHKPWGSTHLLPWSDVSTASGSIGELWFRRPDVASPETALLLKLLLTTEPLSIQVHPDDALARSMGLPNGKTEAWYILSAVPDAKVALGLKHPLSAMQLRSAITDASIADQVVWIPVKKHDVFFVPAGTIHAIGAGLVIVEIQQQSDATFRLFDYGRQRGLHIDGGVVAAGIVPAERRKAPAILSEARAILVVDAHFILEHIDLPADTVWTLDAQRETWMFVIAGDAKVGTITACLGQAIFLDADHVGIEVGADGMLALLAYAGPDVRPDALKPRGAADATATQLVPALPAPSPHHSTEA